MKKVFGFFSNKVKSNKMFKALVVVLAILVITSSGLLVYRVFLLKGGDKSVLQASKNLNTYTMNITMSNDNSHTFKVNQTLSYKNNSGKDLNEVKFNVHAKAFGQGVVNSPVTATKVEDAYPNGVSYGEYYITNVLVNGDKSKHIFDGIDNTVMVVETKGFSNSKKIDIEIEYEFVLPNINHRYGYGNNTINVANFYPIIAVVEDGKFVTTPYNANGDPFYSDMANYVVNLSVPQKYTVAHTGYEVESKVDGGFRKLKLKALAVRDFAFVMSEKFQVANTTYKDVEIKYYYYDDINYESNLKTAKDSIATFSQLFGEYPYNTYSVVKANFLHGGMEYPNLVYISDEITNLQDYKNVIIHETAHQWWYQLVGSNAFMYPWLDEGLTEYSTTLFYEYNPSYNVSAKEIITNSTTNYLSFLDLVKKVTKEDANTSMNRSLDNYETEPEYVYVTYVKGMLLFDSLRDVVGKDNFINSLKYYFKTYKFSNVTPAELIKSFEKISLRSLSSFFNSWIDGKVVIKGS